MRAFNITLALLVLSACSNQQERLCKSHVKEQLLNPETAEMSDFKRYTEEEIKADQLLAEMPRLMDTIISKDGAEYYRMKVRAEGELGNRITKINFCGVNKERDKCACVATS